jgi:hypothetical protein
MDPIENPYTPNAGRRPAVLAGREAEEASFDLMLKRLTRGHSAQSMMIIGLRGVGKTVLLGRFADIADENRWLPVEAEFTDGLALGPLMARHARAALLRLSPQERWLERARKAAGVIRNFTLTVNPDGSTSVGLGHDLPDVSGFADSGVLEADLTDLMVALGQAAREQGRGVVFLLDEVQFIQRHDLAALVVAFHKTIQKDLPISVVLAGLPLLPSLVGEAKSYAERIFTKPEIGALPHDEAALALVGPAEPYGVSYDPDAVERAIAFTEGYPYFIQEVGSIVWDLAAGPRITLDDLEASIAPLEAKLDASFFSIRTAKTTELELAYLRAMAELPRGPKSSGDIAVKLGYSGSQEVGTTRAKLISRGLIYTPSQGLAEFTVPQFDLYLKRNYAYVPRSPQRRKARM